MSTFKWSGVTYGTTSILGTQLNNLPDGSLSARIAWDNHTGRNLFVRVRLYLASFTPGTGGSIDIGRVGRQGNGSTTDEDIVADLLVKNRVLKSGAGAKVLFFEPLLVTPTEGAFFIRNGAKIQLPASGHEMYVDYWNETDT